MAKGKPLTRTNRRPLRALVIGHWSLVIISCTVLAGCARGNAAAEEAQAADDAPKQHPANRLAKESSPYLLQHAHNPVDWYPWGPEAFERATKENKPVFLSIGYSSCYWCHVMERLVFENEEIARYMNEHFVNVKVDREERPDVDDIYMTALQVYFQLIGTRQSGGWPLSMFLTPAGKPIAGGTYFPPEGKNGLPGFPDVMRRMHEVWTKQQAGVEQNAEIITSELRRLMKTRPALAPVELNRELVDEAAKAVLDSYDAEFGGVGFSAARPDAPKFPTPVKLAFLQYRACRYADEDAEKVVRHTLERIAAGGIRDHLGGGFHRYSTDREWHVPHFEKMLYDQAQLADVYIEAYRTGRDERDRRVAEGTLDFVLREMTHPEGGFFSALDAETDGIEGKHYVWSREEVERVLGADNAALFMRAYGMTQPKVFEHGYVLRLPQPLNDLAAELKLSEDALDERLSGLREKLLAVRNQREALLRDDKVLTSWNGLMIRAFARAGKILGREDYTAAAEKAAMFVLTHMRDSDGRLLRTWREGQAKLGAYLDDYAFLSEGLLALYDTTGDEKWRNAARRLTDQMVELFHDETAGGFYFTAHDHETLIARTKTAYSSVIPSGNSVAARNLLRLSSLSSEERYRKLAGETLELFAPTLKATPAGLSNMAVALGEYLDDSAAPPLDSNSAAPPLGKGGPGGVKDEAPPDAHSTPPAPPLGRGGTATPEAEALTPAKAGSEIVQAAAEEPAREKDEPPPILRAKAFLNVERLPAGRQARLLVYLKLSDGWHINANPAQPEGLIPTKVTIVSAAGIKLDNVHYPKGRKLDIPDIAEPALVYDGEAYIYGTLTIPAEAAEMPADEMEIRIRYQPCNERQCLAPKTLKLKGRVPVAPPDEPVQPANEKLFPKPTDAADEPAADEDAEASPATD
ncbi:MAG: DUF255 domain-containing protein [Planctomycetes bacterium]|nr:DUF255 domain-containing protein [Planctomycetota bacterium]